MKPGLPFTPIVSHCPLCLSDDIYDTGLSVLDEPARCQHLVFECDACTGRFWEGRFKCQALLDDAAVLACMTYVDLNPVRSGMANDLSDSQHTSVKHRLARNVDEVPIAPVAGFGHAGPAITTRAYLDLVDWTGRLVHPGKRGVIPADRPRVLDQLGLREREWRAQVLGIESRYWRAIGAVESLVAKAQAMGQRWLKGVGAGAMKASAG